MHCLYPRLPYMVSSESGKRKEKCSFRTPENKVGIPSFLLNKVIPKNFHLDSWALHLQIPQGFKITKLTLEPGSSLALRLWRKYGLTIYGKLMVKFKNCAEEDML